MIIKGRIWFTETQTYRSTRTYYPYYPLANEVARGYSNTTVRHNPCEHSRINILQ
jgi:hypothetical protein